MSKYNGNPGAETVNKYCFECVYATGGCEWVDSNYKRTVPGSVTEPGKERGWVHIISCPKFEEGDVLWTSEKAKSLNAKESSSTS